MPITLLLPVGLSLLLAAICVQDSRRVLRHSTLTVARHWAAIAVATWGVAWLAEAFPERVSQTTRDQLWYAVPLVTLCPLLSALGARRPGHRVWTLFVLLPMLAVLGWPALTVWVSRAPAVVRLEAPTLTGLTLVVLMGAGNYFGTRFSVAVSLLVVSLVLVVVPLTAALAATVAPSWPWRLAATILLGIAASETLRQLRQLPVVPGDWNHLWREFRALFGIVWANRLEERVRLTAQQERWAVSIGATGFEPITGDGLLPPEQTAKRQDQTLRWLLRRFVDPEWIDARLAGAPGHSRKSPDVDGSLTEVDRPRE